MAGEVEVLGQYRKTRNYVWDINALEWVAMQQPIINTDTLTVEGDVSIVSPIGQTAMASAVSVVVASDQSPILVIAI